MAKINGCLYIMKFFVVMADVGFMDYFDNNSSFC